MEAGTEITGYCPSRVLPGWETWGMVEAAERKLGPVCWVAVGGVAGWAEGVAGVAGMGVAGVLGLADAAAIVPAAAVARLATPRPTVTGVGKD